jgi:hypothetical protein
VAANDDGCLPQISRVRRRRSSPLVLVIIILGMLMTYSVALSAMGYDPKILTAVAVATCGLAVQMVRQLLPGTPAGPHRPPGSSPALAIELEPDDV